MKKLLLTSALVCAAATAHAEVKFSGKAEAGVASISGADYTAYTGYDFNIGMSTSTDGGYSISGGFDMGAGSLVDVADKELDAQSGVVGAPKITIAKDGNTLAVQQGAIDDLYLGTDTVTHADVAFNTKIGDVAVASTYDMDTNDYSFSGATSVSGIAVSLISTSENGAGASAYKASASYTMNDIKFTAATNSKGDADPEHKIGASTTIGGVAVTATLVDPSGDETLGEDWDVSAKYSEGALTVGVSTNEETEWEADFAYNLGGGANLFGAADHNETVIAGLSFKF